MYMYIVIDIILKLNALLYILVSTGKHTCICKSTLLPEYHPSSKPGQCHPLS